MKNIVPILLNNGMNDEQSMGHGSFVWWLGVVEDRNDPKKLGRCRVRCIGFHTKDKQLLPTSDLPWATPIQSITSAAISGVGQSPTGIVEGTWVLGFFLDGNDAQMPVMLGTIAGIPAERLNPTSQGFSDPNDEFPRDSYLTESDVNRLARNESTTNTIIATRDAGLDTGILVANSGPSWSEPASAYNTTYPHNHVLETENGHVWEIDDTAGSERTNRWHPAGTFEEIRPDGSRVVKVAGDDYEIVVQDKNVLVKGNCNITVNGNTTLYTKGDLDMQTGGDVVHMVAGTYTLIAGGNVLIVGPRIDLNP